MCACLCLYRTIYSVAHFFFIVYTLERPTYSHYTSYRHAHARATYRTVCFIRFMLRAARQRGATFFRVCACFLCVCLCVPEPHGVTATAVERLKSKKKTFHIYNVYRNYIRECLCLTLLLAGGWLWLEIESCVKKRGVSLCTQCQ